MPTFSGFHCPQMVNYYPSGNSTGQVSSIRQCQQWFSSHKISLNLKFRHPSFYGLHFPDLVDWPPFLNIEPQSKEPQKVKGITSTFDIPCSIFCGSKKCKLLLPVMKDAETSLQLWGHDHRKAFENKAPFLASCTRFSIFQSTGTLTRLSPFLVR